MHPTPNYAPDGMSSGPAPMPHEDPERFAGIKRDYTPAEVATASMSSALVMWGPLSRYVAVETAVVHRALGLDTASLRRARLGGQHTLLCTRPAEAVVPLTVSKDRCRLTAAVWGCALNVTLSQDSEPFGNRISGMLYGPSGPWRCHEEEPFYRGSDHRRAA